MTDVSVPALPPERLPATEPEPVEEPRKRPFAEPSAPAKEVERPLPTVAADVEPGDQILRLVTVARVDKTAEAVTITTDDGATSTYGPGDAITIWPPDTFPPL
jgi:hypothetical protein